MIELIKQRFNKLVSREGPSSAEELERGAERHRRAFITGGVATAARFVQLGASLITIPLTLKYLGNERFGLWMTISSVLAMAAFADFGVGNGVLNTVASAFGKDDTEGIRRAVSSGFAILTVIAVLLISIFAAIFPFVNWGDFFRVTSAQARMEAGPALTVFVVCFALNISMDVVQRVQLGLQQGYRYSLWQFCGSIMSFAGILVGIKLHVSLTVLVATVAGAPIVATALNTIHFFGFVRPDLRPTRKLITRDVISQITKLGGLFFVLQAVASVSGATDNLIIAKSLGAVNVPEFSIPQRMFGIISMMLAMLVAPLWPAYREAISRRDFSWVKRTLSQSIILVVIASCSAASLLLVLAPHIIYWWVGSSIHPPFLMLLGFSVWTVFECVSFTMGAFLNGAEAIRFQICLSVLFGAACISLKMVLIRHFGVSALPWASTICVVLVQLLPWIIFVPHFLKKMESRSKLAADHEEGSEAFAITQTLGGTD